MYWDSLNADGGTGHFSSASIGFGMLGLCMAARLGRMPYASASTKLLATLNAFDTHWWPWCRQDRLCPHWMEQWWNPNTNANEMRLWANGEYSTIDTALFVASAHYATQCLQPHVDPTATDLVRKYLTGLRWGFSMPTACDDRRMKLLIGVSGSDTIPWNEYQILAYVAAAAESANASSQSGTGHCPGREYYHRYFRADAYHNGLPGGISFDTYANASLLTDCCASSPHGVRVSRTNHLP
jgi:hypothetical protein